MPLCSRIVIIIISIDNEVHCLQKFHSTFSGNISIAVQRSIYLIESLSCLRYIPHTNQNDYIRIKHNSRLEASHAILNINDIPTMYIRCCAHRGRVGFGRHDLFLHPSCATTGEQLNSIIVTAVSVNWELQTTKQECKYPKKNADK